MDPEPLTGQEHAQCEPKKLNCVYCGYANGVIGHAREIAARTEQYADATVETPRIAIPQAGKKAGACPRLSFPKSSSCPSRLKNAWADIMSASRTIRWRGSLARWALAPLASAIDRMHSRD